MMRRIAMFVWGFAFLSGVALAQASEVKDIRRLRVVDANGRTVGTVQSIHNAMGDPTQTATVALQISVSPPRFHVPQLVVLEVFEQDIEGNAEVVFQSSDCSGTPFLATPLPPLFPHSLFPLVAVGFPGLTVYVPAPNASPQPVVAHPVGTGGRCVPLGGNPGTYIPAIPLVDLSQRFTPPFQVRSGSFP